MATSKKAKKAALKNAAAAAYAPDFNDQAALHRRAQRFQREHELEKTKHVRNGQASKASFYDGGMTTTRSGSATPDEPEGDPVSFKRFSTALAYSFHCRTLLTGIGTPLLAHHKKSLRTIYD